jgi:hypothetical protein
MPSVPGRRSPGEHSSVDGHLVQETEAYLKAQEVIGMIENAVRDWQGGRLTVGQFLALVVECGLYAIKATHRGWDFLDDRAAP